jgi:hypothetical protein
MEKQLSGEENVQGKNSFYFLITAALTALLFLTLYRFDFEPGSPLNNLLPLLFGVFIIHFWLPIRYGLPFLAIASCVAAFFLLDPVSAAGLILILIAFTILVRLNISFRLKVILSLIFIAGLFIARTGIVRVPFIAYAVPVAGSMLMFRAALVLYEHRYNKIKPTFIQDFTFLFLVPNLALPLFPLVDYKTFLRNYLPHDEVAIRQGISRIALAIIQLLLHRFIYIFLLPSSSTIHNAHDALAYITLSYIGILHFTGLLWLGAGYLGLLGFRLPAVFDNVFLVDSFGAIWRRINIYWREFLLKLVYFPLYFALRKKIKRAVLITSLIVFGVTALLHGWQWFWLLGSMKASSTGIIYWIMLAICISIAISKEETSQPVKEEKTIRFAIIKTLRISGMFLFMSFTWSLWNSASIGNWFHLLSHFREGGIQSWIKIAAFFLLIFTTAIIAWMISFRLEQRKKSEKNSWIIPALAVILFLPLTFVSIREKLPLQLQDISEKLALPKLNSEDQNDATENYYDRMLASDGKGKRPWEMTYAGNNSPSGLDEACTRRKDMVVRELIPSNSTDLKTWKIITNRFGMRDQEYTMEKPPGTFRIAILGGSYEMGSGVPQDSVFENLLEKMMNATFPDKKIEILNFAVGGYHLPQLVWVMQQKAKSFHPDLVLCFVHPADARRNCNYLSALIRNSADLIYPELYTVRNEAGAKQGMDADELKNRLDPFNGRITKWSLEQINFSCDSIGSAMTVVYLPSLSSDPENPQEYSGTGGYLNNLHCGFIYLDHIFPGGSAVFGLRDDPTHPNANGHLQIALRLAKILSESGKF